MAHYSSRYAIRSLPSDPTREIFKAAKYGDAVSLIHVLHDMKVDERTSALATESLHVRGGLGRVCNTICTPLVVAAEYGNLDCVKILLRYGADVEGNSKFWTPLFAAVAGGHVDVLSCLIEHGADVNLRTYENCTPLMRAASQGNLQVISFLVEHGANVDLQDKNGQTALHYAIPHARRSHDVLSCLIKNGANVNIRANDNYTPLMRAIKDSNENVVTFLVEHGANMDLRDKNGETVLHYAAVHYSDRKSIISCREVLSCLIKNGADVDARTNEECTPLMKASLNGHYNVVECLVKHGADVKLQDKNGDTALHYAIRSKDIHVVRQLWSESDAAQLCRNKRRLTPLLSASNALMVSVVEELSWSLEEEEEIGVLELLGASFATQYFIDHRKAFEYMKRGMEERFYDPADPVLKQVMEPVEPYQNRKESQTLDELARIEGDVDAITMEGLIIRERILGTDNLELLGPIQEVADRYKHSWNFDVCIGLQRHAMEISQLCNQPIESQLHGFIGVIYNMLHNNFTPSQKIMLQVLEQIVVEYKKQGERSITELVGEPLEEMKQFLNGVHKQEVEKLLDSFLRLLQIIARMDLEDKILSQPELLQKLPSVNLQDNYGNTLLHLASKDRSKIAFYYPPSPFEFPCAETIKLLLNIGFNVDAVNSSGDTALHIAATFKPSDGKTHLLKDMLEVLLDGGSHHDFVNNEGKTAIDMAQADDACRILSEKKAGV